MASQFQNRLVGISILVALVVLFLPTIIDGKKIVYVDEFVATPIHPEIKEHTQKRAENINNQNESINIAESSDTEEIREASDNEEKWQVEEIASTLTVNKEKVTTPKNEVTESTTKVVTNNTAKKKPVPKNAWTIQLGAFQNAANINTLLKTLHKAGYQAHTVPREVIDGELTRVFVGPDVSKTKLEKQLPRLKRLTKLQGKLYPFDAVNP